MGRFSNPFKSAVKLVTKIVTAPIKIITKALSWIAPKPPEIPDFGTTDFDDFETGILLNKQSPDLDMFDPINQLMTILVFQL